MLKKYLQYLQCKTQYSLYGYLLGCTKCYQLHFFSDIIMGLSIVPYRLSYSKLK